MHCSLGDSRGTYIHILSFTKSFIKTKYFVIIKDVGFGGCFSSPFLENPLLEKRGKGLGF